MDGELVRERTRKGWHGWVLATARIRALSSIEQLNAAHPVPLNPTPASLTASHPTHLCAAPAGSDESVNCLGGAVAGVRCEPQPGRGGGAGSVQVHRILRSGFVGEAGGK